MSTKSLIKRIKELKKQGYYEVIAIQEVALQEGMHLWELSKIWEAR